MSGQVNDGMDEDSIMDSEDRIEKAVDIYVSAEAVRDMKHKKDKEDFDTQTPQHTGSDSVRNRSSRSVAVCLVLLCVFLLTAVIVLCVIFTQERQQLISKNENLTVEREQLILKNTNLTNEREQLRNELQIHDRWTYYHFSLYYMPNETKNWTESRRYCTERGADLIIINSKEEYDFVMKMSGTAAVYVGLSDIDVEGTWKWVDGSNMTSGFRFWAFNAERREPDSGNNKVDEDCAVTVAVPQPEFLQLVGGLDVACYKVYRWICEKRISQLILP